MRQSQLNLAWARASSRHLREQSRIRRTLKMLQELLRDPVLAKEREGATSDGRGRRMELWTHSYQFSREIV